MAKISPLLIEYGKLADTKKGWKTLSWDASLVKLKPDVGFSEKPVMIHDVIVSGTFLCKTFDDSLFKKH
jgi:hypothetical protein